MVRRWLLTVLWMLVPAAEEVVVMMTLEREPR